MIQKTVRAICLLSFPLAATVSFSQAKTSPGRNKSAAEYVNPIIGTQRMGHTYPGATYPFGMVQLSPDTDTIPYAVDGKYNPDVYKYCAGYQYDDKTIVGFSHTHFSGTGHSDLGDFLLMPTAGPLQMNPGTSTDPKGGFRSAFSHNSEETQAGYYKVKLDDDDITAELTSTARVGIHKYSFPKTENAHVILDMMSGIYNYDAKNIWTFIRVINDSTVTGYRQTNGWGRTRVLYFAMTFSKKFTQYGTKDYNRSVYRGFWGKFDQSKNFPDIAGSKIRMYFDFNTTDGKPVIVKFALSPVSTEGALNNLKVEAPGWNFDQYRAAATAAWNRELDKIKIEGSDEEKTNFYTSMYHAFINPTVYQDVDGSYRGLDQNIHKAAFTNYSTFSLWDTYRALHPFFNLIQPKRNSDMVKSMLAHFDQSVEHMLPVWSHHANENWCMSGYHSVSVVADAIIKGNTGFDTRHALEACVTTARQRSYEGIGSYIDKGYIPAEKNGASVSTTLEYAYDDWCIAQAAKKLGRSDLYQEFIKRSANFRNVFDNNTGFMHARMDNGSFTKDFDALSTSRQGFIEGNAWNFSLFVPHDPAALIGLLGGKQKATHYLDTLFTMHLPDEFFAETEDITRDGIIGGYVHGNEPSHHVAYLYNYTDNRWKTQERVRMILKNQYKAAPDGLGGNDDCGQMSAWYIFSSLGFYPMAPGSDQYELGSPAVDQATLKLENGKTFTVIAHDQAADHVYVSKVLLNGKALTAHYLTHGQVMAGGKLEFFMSATKP
ncbi:MAG: glycoside hydrolase family 92 protein [Chitinophagaceae bacterium]|nr:MAG: glycoside hydrolase family 92 protein [Chitinophagaceae bacterium]